MPLSKRIGLVAAPFICILLLFISPPEGLSLPAWKVIAVACFMLIWWVTEAVPIAVTALLPIVLLPLFGVMPINTASAPYASPIVFLFMGGFMIALAMEKWELHRRIALGIVRITGTNANGILLGFMLATAVLSMWISNTATTIMMLPIALSVIGLLTQKKEDYPEKGIRNFALTMMLGIAYAANIGGTATLIGTPPNVVFAGYLQKTYQVEITFFEWFKFGLPFAAILLLTTYFFIVKILHPNNLGTFKGGKTLIEEEYQKLGEITLAERRVLVIFLLTALAWIFRTSIVEVLKIVGLGFVELTDYGIAMIASVILFITPIDFSTGRFVLEWKDTERLPWGILLLFGGGLSLAGALSETGIIDLIGKQFEVNQGLSFWIILGVTAVSLFLTEVMSNVALVTIFLPVVGGIAIGLDLPPALMMIPVTLAASCAFMLPMSTPPNAIVFASGHLTVGQMARAGIILNIIAIGLIALLTKFVIPLVF